MKVTPLQYQTFLLSFAVRMQYPKLRLGQAFMNAFMPEERNPDLFYAGNEEAKSMIEDNYVDWYAK
jgi:hypothetical protein